MQDRDWLRMLGSTYVVGFGPLAPLAFAVGFVALVALRRKDPLFGWAAGAVGLLLAVTVLGGLLGPAWADRLSVPARLFAPASIALVGAAAYRMRDGHPAGVVAGATSTVVAVLLLAGFLPFGAVGVPFVVLAAVATVCMGVSLFLLGTSWAPAPEPDYVRVV